MASANDELRYQLFRGERRSFVAAGGTAHRATCPVAGSACGRFKLRTVAQSRGWAVPRSTWRGTFFLSAETPHRIRQDEARPAPRGTGPVYERLERLSIQRFHGAPRALRDGHRDVGEFLDAIVAAVGHLHFAERADRDAERRVELAVAAAERPPLTEERARRTEFLDAVVALVRDVDVVPV